MLHKKKGHISKKKDEKREHVPRIVTILLCKTPPHFSARSSLNYEILSEITSIYKPTNAHIISHKTL